MRLKIGANALLIGNFFLTSQAPLTKTAITFPQNRQNFVADEASSISQRKTNFPKVQRISIW